MPADQSIHQTKNWGFTLILSVDDRWNLRDYERFDDLAESLFISGLDDGTFGGGTEPFVNVDRDGESLPRAVGTAVLDAQKVAGVTVERVDPDDDATEPERVWLEIFNRVLVLVRDAGDATELVKTVEVLLPQAG